MEAGDRAPGGGFPRPFPLPRLPLLAADRALRVVRCFTRQTTLGTEVIQVVVVVAGAVVVVVDAVVVMEGDSQVEGGHGDGVWAEDP